MDNGITLKILDFKDGLTQYYNVKYIRIKSEKYNLMIFEKYIPIIGEINGSITFEVDGETKELENINGYYINKKSTFDLILKS